MYNCCPEEIKDLYGGHVNVYVVLQCGYLFYLSCFTELWRTNKRPRLSSIACLQPQMSFPLSLTSQTTAYGLQGALAPWRVNCQVLES